MAFPSLCCRHPTRRLFVYIVLGSITWIFISLTKTLRRSDVNDSDIRLYDVRYNPVIVPSWTIVRNNPGSILPGRISRDNFTNHYLYDGLRRPTAYNSITNVSKSSSKNTEFTKPISHNLTMEHVARLELVRAHCGSTASRQTLSTRSLSAVLVDKQHKVLYCSVPKCSTTSWLLMVAYLTGKVSIKLTTQEDNAFKAWKPEEMSRIGIKYLNRVSQTEASSNLRDFYKFLVVRNPYERLISAFVDKFNDVPDRRYYHVQYGKVIIRLFRKDASPSSLAKGNDVTFPEFIKFVLYQAKTRHSFDEHWKPITQTCHPCSVKYDLISKMETLVEDAGVILRTGFKATHPGLFPSANRQQGPQDPNDRIRKYFSSIPKEDIAEVKKIYKDDFLSFGYDMDVL